MKSFPLLVLTPNEVAFEGEITSLVIPTADGTIGFLAGREDCVFAFVPGEFRFETESGTIVLETDGGVLEMNGGKASVLCGTAYPKEEAAFRRSKRASELSEEKRKQEQSLADYKLTRMALVRAFEKLRRGSKS